jgi:hypothetical protein
MGLVPPQRLIHAAGQHPTFHRHPKRIWVGRNPSADNVPALAPTSDMPPNTTEVSRIGLIPVISDQAV